MNTARITKRAAQAATAGPADLDGCYPDGLTEAAIDALIEEVDRELANEQQTVTVRIEHSFTDARRARRAERRAGREALRSLPARIEPADVAGEVAV
ncbi:hypothetical protein [Prauserella muralis]|uniref:Uncharacterized protein n=1 Tax=Prauserella muralis TaxID=588067 RepID=A0A2V4BAZ5_9PSEU|nr:hypothetical protein [Prauserella muralis]PXY31692.1 hypothetical protein BAY60_04840 [Prauserella muralis]TWE13931.1 hypothetical protein FHX69_6064 [Prauserella muralis]